MINIENILRELLHGFPNLIKYLEIIEWLWRPHASVCAHATGHLPTLLLFANQTLAEVIELLSQDGNQLLLALEDHIQSGCVSVDVIVLALNLLQESTLHMATSINQSVAFYISS